MNLLNKITSKKIYPVTGAHYRLFGFSTASVDRLCLHLILIMSVTTASSEPQRLRRLSAA